MADYGRLAFVKLCYYFSMSSQADTGQELASSISSGTPARLSREERLEVLLQLVTTAPRTIEELADELGVAVMTIYRDVAALQDRGLAHRERGLVTVAPTRQFEADLNYRVGQFASAKEALTRAAAVKVRAGDSVLLDDSSSGVYLARALLDVGPITIVTNSLAVAREVKTAPEITLLITGGEYATWADALFGPTAIETLQGLRADISFMSASAITDNVVYHPHPQMLEVKRAILAASAHKVLYVDNSKFTRTALHAVAPVADFDTVVVEQSIAPEMLKQLKTLVPEVIVAEPVSD